MKYNIESGKVLFCSLTDDNDVTWTDYTPG